MYRDLLIFLSAPLVVGCTIGAWLATGRLYAAHLWPSFARLPAWIPWILAMIVALGGYVIQAGQLIAVSEDVYSAAVEWDAAAIVAMLLSPIWPVSAGQAMVGMALHYLVDVALRRFDFAPPVHEGLAWGLRAAWGVIGLLTLFFGLQATYTATLRAQGTILGLLERFSAGQLILNLGCGGLAALSMFLPRWAERTRPEPPVTARSSPPPPPLDSPHASG